MLAGQVVEGWAAVGAGGLASQQLYQLRCLRTLSDKCGNARSSSSITSHLLPGRVHRPAAAFWLSQLGRTTLRAQGLARRAGPA